MPRFGKDFKVYNRIFPSLTVDVARILDPASTPLSQKSLQLNQSMECWLCRQNQAVISCVDCARDVFRVESGKEVCLCEDCSRRSHSTRSHQISNVTSSADVTSSFRADTTMFSNMKLLSVICIETSHYVCFTHCDGQWLFHDSMADRMCELLLVFIYNNWFLDLLNVCIPMIMLHIIIVWYL